jgi:hypothetical protein
VQLVVKDGSESGSRNFSPDLLPICYPEHVKRIAIFLVAVVMLGLTANLAKAGSLGPQLADLESHIKWNAVDSAWKSLRDDWVRETAGCQQAACVAAQLLNLEQHVKWKAVEGSWKTRRPGWINDCRSATTDRDVAKLLLEFETNVGQGAVDDGWKARRESWISELKGG